MAALFAPIDDEPIECRVRLWQGRSVHVFVRSSYRKRCGLFDGTPMNVELAGRTFDAVILWSGEFYSNSSTIDLKPSYFGLGDHADYDAQARIDWDAALPDQVYEALASDVDLAAAWRGQTCATIRHWLNTIARARKPSSRLERELQLVGKLRGLAADPR